MIVFDGRKVLLEEVYLLYVFDMLGGVMLVVGKFCGVL